MSKIRAILDHASSIHSYLNNTSEKVLAFPDPEVCLQSLPLARKDVSAEEQRELHSMGVRLWNSCCEPSSRHYYQTADGKSKIAKVRTFAYFLLESALGCGNVDVAGHIKALEIGCRAAKACLANNELLLAEKLVHSLVDHSSQVTLQSGVVQANSQDKAIQARTDFLLLRVALAWKQNSFSLADHLYMTSQQTQELELANYGGRLADLCCEIGVDQLDKKQYEPSLVWLRRARKHIECSDGCPDVDDPDELRLNILHATVRTLEALKHPQKAPEAVDTFETLKKNYGQKLPVLLLQLEMIGDNQPLDERSYHDILLSIIRTVHLSEPNHKMIMFHIHRLKAESVPQAYITLKQYILSRLVYDEWDDRTAMAIVTLIWLAQSCPDLASTLTNDLDIVSKAWSKPLPSDAAQAAVIMLWRLSDAHCENKDKVVEGSLCQVALSRLFANMDDHNRAKIQRRLILCCVDSGDLVRAYKTWQELAGAEKNATLSKYLRFRIALGQESNDALESCLNSFLNSNELVRELLLACADDTIQLPDLKRASHSTQRVLDKLVHTGSLDPEVCELLQKTAQLHVSVLDQEGGNVDHETLSMLANIFQTIANHSSHPKDDQGGNISQAHWEYFAKTGFNIALTHARQWPTKFLVDILEHSLGLQTSHADATEDGSEWVQHQGKVLFLQAITYASAAGQWRSENTIEDIPRTSYHAREAPAAECLQHHLYQQVIQRYYRLKSMFDDTKLDGGGVDTGIQEQAANTFVLAFEAQLFLILSDVKDGLHLNDSSLVLLLDDLPQLTLSLKAHACLADLILSATIPEHQSPQQANFLPTRLPIQTSITLLGTLLGLIRDGQDYDVIQAARWIRCIVQLVLDAQPAVLTTTTTSQAAAAPTMSNATSTITTTVSTVNTATLDLLSPVVTEAIELARSVVNNAVAKTQQPAKPSSTRMSKGISTQPAAQLYPSDELQWLATTLFNLAVDLYFAGAAADGPQEKPGEASLGTAEQWATRAVQLADVLALNEGLASTAEQVSRDVNGSAGGGHGVLATLLRYKAASVGWVVDGVVAEDADAEMEFDVDMDMDMDPSLT